MSLAWSTLALVVLVLPGLFFLLGLYSPERYSRDVGRRNAIGELGVIVFIALVVHGLILGTLGFVDFGFGTSLISGTIDDFFLYDLKTRYEAADLFRHYWPFAILYALLSVVIGYGIGYYCGTKVISGLLRSLARHRWLYELIDATKKSKSSSVAVFAYVMTNVQVEQRVLMYKGFLREFFMTPEGKIAHLVLSNCARFYMHLEPSVPTTSLNQLSLPIMSGDDADASQWLYLVIEGEDISNVVFEATAPVFVPPEDYKALLELLERRPRPTAEEL